MIDYKYNHDKKCEFFDYIKNFLKDGSPHEQILEELARFILDIVHNQRAMKEGL